MAGILGGVQLRVKPEALNEKAVAVENNVRKMKSAFEDIKATVEKSSTYWIGEAGELHRKNYEAQVEDIDVILRRLDEHPGDLRAIAQTYTTAELKAEERIEELPGNVL